MLAITDNTPGKSPGKSLLQKYKLNAKVSRERVVHGKARFHREKWVQEERIGSGASGSVFLQRNEGTAELRAVKKLGKDDWGKVGRNIERELEHLISVVDRPDLFVKFLGWYENDEFVFYVMEYLKHGDLGQYIKSSRQEACRNAREISKQLLEGLVVLHGRSICHRDLKPQNVLIASLSPIRVKLADFGISKCEVTSIMKTTGVGTMGYIAPEVLRILPPQSPVKKRQYSNAVDMWAFGCLVNLLLTGEEPFSLGGYFDMQALMEFCGGQVDLFEATLEARVKEPCALDFVKRLLTYDGCQRMSASEALAHPWITNAKPASTGIDPLIMRSITRDRRCRSAIESYTTSVEGPSVANTPSPFPARQHRRSSSLRDLFSGISVGMSGGSVSHEAPSGDPKVRESDAHSTRPSYWVKRLKIPGSRQYLLPQQDNSEVWWRNR